MSIGPRLAVVASVLGLAGAAAPFVPVAPARGVSLTSSPQTRIYWDQNEQEDWLVHPGLQQTSPLIPPYDANGQMCIFPDGTGRFTTAYNPTTDPTNPGFTKPLMYPPIGETVWNRHGSFTGQTIAVPGPYLGGDIPGNTANPYDGSFNNNGTYTGCVFDSKGNLFADDLDNSQGGFPPTDSGRLIEWFAGTNYSTYCIIFGPTSGGTGPHHVDGSGGLSQPGTLALDSHGNVLVPVVGGTSGEPTGGVLQFAGASMPSSAASCASPANMPGPAVHPSVLINTAANNQPTPQGIALDPTDGDWAVSSVLLGSAVAWYSPSGQPDLKRPPVPGDPPPQQSAVATTAGYSPEGLAFAPDGTLYFADIHIVCVNQPSESNPGSFAGCGPASNEGQVLRVTFSTVGSIPSVPTPVNTEPLNFPVSVTACTLTGGAVCPAPPGFPVR